MLIVAWIMMVAFLVLGFIFFSFVSAGVFVGLIFNLALLPLRIFIWLLRIIF